MQKPNPTQGLRHVALYVKNFDACRHFYIDLLGMTIDWEPDADNLYLTSGHDNFALHRAPHDFSPSKYQHLDHIGFFLKHREEVDQWHQYLLSHQVTIKASPKDHRDGTRSFYCQDPDGNIVQLIYYPRLPPSTD
jgi:catechol 2,3-dioxygenase-like lactoylglutathione lyase family enzyme